jgi:hypothetical protein
MSDCLHDENAGWQISDVVMRQRLSCCDARPEGLPALPAPTWHTAF